MAIRMILKNIDFVDPNVTCANTMNVQLDITSVIRLISCSLRESSLRRVTSSIENLVEI